MSNNEVSFTALEFFAGIGLARAGMERAGVHTIWANDIDVTKCALYEAQWGSDHLTKGDVFKVDPDAVPHADVAWASSPCTDLSLAGKRDGLISGTESRAFFGFTSLIKKMGSHSPQAIVLENVSGLASSHGGDDFRTVIKEFNDLGYSVDAFELNARRWLPQSRPRIFVVGLKSPIDGGSVDSPVRPDRVSWIHSDARLRTHVTPLHSVPELLSRGLSTMVETIGRDDCRWWSDDRVDAFIASLSDVQRVRFDSLVASETGTVRTAYRRTRCRRPVWEMRGDDISGCLRTARGGSSKQAVVFLGNGEARIRWMTGLEYARLQGAGNFHLEGFSEMQIQYAFGDAVAVPVVEWLVSNAVLPALIAEGGHDDGCVVRYSRGRGTQHLLRVV